MLTQDKHSTLGSCLSPHSNLVIAPTGTGNHGQRGCRPGAEDLQRVIFTGSTGPICLLVQACQVVLPSVAEGICIFRTPGGLS